MEKKNKL